MSKKKKSNLTNPNEEDVDWTSWRNKWHPSFKPKDAPPSTIKKSPYLPRQVPSFLQYLKEELGWGKQRASRSGASMEKLINYAYVPLRLEAVRECLGFSIGGQLSSSLFHNLFDHSFYFLGLPLAWTFFFTLSRIFLCGSSFP